MTFAHPQILWLLLVFPPALIGFLWWSWRKRQNLMTQFIEARLLPGLISGLSAKREKFRAAGLVLAVVCLILALARPQWGFSWEEVKRRGLDIVAAIDTSKSMLAQDIAPNRLARAKLAALDLMQFAKSDRLGLVAFAGNAFLECPLTSDDTAFRQSVEALDVNTLSQGGTAIAEAIEAALGAFKEGENFKVLVLFTDGEDQDSGALEAAKKAAAAGLQIFTIGIGSAEGELLRVTDAKGNSDYVRDEQGNVVKSHLNQTLLQQIAGATEKGFYLPLQGAKTIDTLYEKGLAPLPKTEGKEKWAKRAQERYYWPLSLAIVLLLAEMLFPERKRESKTKSTPASLLRARAGQTVALLMLLVWPGLLFGSPSSALREYKAGKYDQALKEYEQLLQRKGDDPRLHFNAGAAAYRNQQFDEAAKQFNASQAARDLNLQGRAYYNEGNSLFHLGERVPDPKQRQEAWEKALQDYQSTLKLNDKDADAKFNYDFVKKKIEELKQQQQQSQQNKQDKQDKDQKQDQQNQNQQQQDQQKQDQQKDQSQQQQRQQAQQDQKQDSQQQQAEQKKQEEQQAKQSEEQKKEQQQAQQSRAQTSEKQDEKDKQDAAAYAKGEMTPEQARQLLDAQKGDEKMLQLKPEQKPVDHSRSFKDW